MHIKKIIKETPASLTMLSLYTGISYFQLRRKILENRLNKEEQTKIIEAINELSSDISNMEVEFNE